jgi:hypothetical protein
MRPGCRKEPGVRHHPIILDVGNVQRIIVVELISVTPIWLHES